MTDNSQETGQTVSDAELYEGSQKREILGHPIGLSILFMTEMWERFTYYGMRAILILYLTKYLLFSTGEASAIYGSYTALVYLLPILGGYLADKYLGKRKAVAFGAILLAIGNMSLIIQGPPAEIGPDGLVVRSDFYVALFFLSLAVISTGTGFLKANISSIVGTLYGPKDPRRDGGFSIFYMGINLGSFFSILAVGAVGEIYGWGYGFALAGLGMLIGLAVFLLGQPLLEGRAEPPSLEKLSEKILGGLVSREHAIYLSGLLVILVAWLMLQTAGSVGVILGLSGLIMVGVVLWYAIVRCEAVERDRLIVAIILIAFQAVFWALFEQQGASLTLLADQQFDLNVFGIQFYASQVQTLNPLIIILFAPVFSVLWVWLAKRGKEPSTPAKFALAMGLVGLAYIVMAFGLGLDDSNMKSILWMVILYLLMTWGELCLSPVGLSMVTKLSAAHIVGAMMGTWFLFSAIGNYLAGLISALTGSEEHGATSGAVDVAQTITVYNQIGLMAIGVGVFILLITPWMRRRMHGVH